MITRCFSGPLVGYNDVELLTLLIGDHKAYELCFAHPLWGSFSWAIVEYLESDRMREILKELERHGNRNEVS